VERTQYMIDRFGKRIQPLLAPTEGCLMVTICTNENGAELSIGVVNIRSDAVIPILERALAIQRAVNEKAARH